MVCFGDVITIGGQNVSTPGIYSDTLRNVAGCDSLIVNVTLSMTPEVEFVTIDATICAGSSIEVGGRIINAEISEEFSISNSIGCDSVTYNLDVIVSDFLEIIIDTVLCVGETIEIGNQLYSEVTNDELIILDNHNCDSIIYIINIDYKELREELIDTLLCEGEVLTIQGQSYTEATVDQLFIKDTEGCDSLILNVILNYEERLQLPDQEIEVLRSIPTQIDVAYDENYQSVMWDSVDGLSCTDCLDPIVALDQDVTYQLTVTHADGCDEIIDVRFRVIEEIIIAEEDIYLPNVINLNDPSNNRLFLQSSPDIEISYSLFVYDRWGNQVFESENINSNDASQGWDGSYDGDFGLTQGVYIYKVVTGSEEVIYGDILILR